MVKRTIVNKKRRRADSTTHRGNAKRPRGMNTTTPMTIEESIPHEDAPVLNLGASEEDSDADEADENVSNQNHVDQARDGSDGVVTRILTSDDDLSTEDEDSDDEPNSEISRSGTNSARSSQSASDMYPLTQLTPESQRAPGLGPMSMCDLVTRRS